MFNRFINDKSGNMAIMFAVTVMLLLGGIGAAVDYSAMSTKKKSYQNLSDLAVLAAARSGKSGEGELLTIAKQYIDENHITGEPLDVKLKITDAGRIQVAIKGAYTPMIMGMFGNGAESVSAAAEAPLPSSEPVNLVLVLDTTGSMMGTKLTALKSAATELVTQLEEIDSDNLKVGVVPFSQHINVGVARRGAEWLDVADDSSTTRPEVCYMKKDASNPHNCSRVNRTCTNDGTSYDCSYDRCDYDYGPEYEYCYIPTSSETWNGCLGSRTAPWNSRSGFRGKKIDGLTNIGCGTEILPLTTDMSKVQATIDALSASGETYIPSGLLWGWRTLSPNAPLKEAGGEFSDKRKSVMILMTDGANTKSKNGKKHDGANSAAANALTRKMCREIKRDKIELYAIAFEISDMGAKRVLRECASKEAMFFDASDAAELNKAFKNIGAGLVKIRLTH